MRLRALLPVCALVSSVDTSSRATPDDAGADPVVVQVGESVVRASELRFLLGRLHEFERESYGKTPAEVRRAFVERRLVPELLYAEEAKRLGSPNDPTVKAKVRSALAQALKADLEQRYEEKLGRAEVEAYCKRAGTEPADAGAGACKGDLSGYRVVMRRKHSSEELERLAKELRERHAKDVSYALLEGWSTGPVDPSVTPPPQDGQAQP